MKIQYILLFAISFLINSCIIQLVGNCNEFEMLSESEKKKIKKLENFNELKSDYIYELNGLQLKEELGNHNKSLVYIFTNGCPSDYCIPLQLVEKYAKENDYKLFLVMTGYYKLNEALSQQIQSQLFSIDVDYYGLEKRSKYTHAFKTDIGYYEYTNSEKYVGSYIFYKKESIADIKFRLE